MFPLADKHYNRASFGVIFIFLLAAFMTIDDYGMGWDEITRWESGDRKLEYYRTLVSSDTDNQISRMAGDRYPGLFDLPLAAIHAVVGGNRMLQGHALSILFGALGLASTAWLAYSVFGARTAFFSTLFLAIFPRFYGHAMINPKDIPFLATYTLGLAGVFWICRQLSGNGKAPWGSFALCGLFFGLAGSSRIPGLVLVAIGAICWGATLLRFQFHTSSSRKIQPGQWGRLVLGICTSGCIALLTLLLFFPRAQTAIFSSVIDVAETLHTVSGSVPLLYAGQFMDAKDAPFAYAIRFFIISTPLWILALFLCGTTARLAELVQSRRNLDSAQLMHLLFICVSAFPWIYITITSPALHNGLRHVLFAVPPIIILAGYGADWLLEIIGRDNPRLRIPAIAVLVVVSILQVQHLVRMHPYQYVSFNFLAGDKGTIPNRFEAEYWCTATKHLLEQLPVIVQGNGDSSVPVRIRASGALDSARSFVPEGFVLTDDFADADYYVSITTFRIDAIIDGEEVFRIERGGIPIGVIKKLSNANEESAAH